MQHHAQIPLPQGAGTGHQPVAVAQPGQKIPRVQGQGFPAALLHLLRRGARGLHGGFVQFVEPVNVQLHRHVRVPGILPVPGDDALLLQPGLGQQAAQGVGRILQGTGGVFHLVIAPKGLHDLLVGGLCAHVQEQVYQQLDGLVHTAALFDQVLIPDVNLQAAEHVCLQAFGFLHGGFLLG